MSFNGAATFSRGNPSGYRDTVVTDIGFNGAATLQSRKSSRPNRPLPRHRCFNGAATFSRGNLATNLLASNALESFNGAATLQSRKSDCIESPGAGAWCFNGAATLQSRKWLIDTARVMREGKASMGPRLFSRGNPPQNTPTPAPRARFNGAATLQSRKSGCSNPGLRPLAGFNGAATLQSRK